VGVESLSEIVDMELEGRVTALDVKEKLNQTLPEGIRIIEAEEVPFSSSPASLLRRSVFWIRLKDLLPKEEATAKFEKALDEEVLFVDQERKGKQRRVDVRPMIGSMEVKLHPPWAGNGEAHEGERTARNNNGWGVHLVLLDVLERTAKPLEIVGTILGLGKDSVSQCDVVKIE
jgi:radical SAM-linked protein